MYAPTGFGCGELGDIDVIEHDGRLHLFHLTLPAHDRIAHLVSEDGLSWTPLPDALRTSDPGRFDDDMLWTMGVIRHDGRFHMLYTGLGTADRGRVQRIGHAVSDDLVHWTKREGPVAQARAPYETDAMNAPWVSFRDPKPVVVGDEVLVPVCARVADGPPRRRGAVALLTTRDFESFELCDPVFAPQRYFELECPQLFTVDGHWYLTAGVIDDHAQRYWLGEGPRGPFHPPPDNRLLPPGHYCARVFTWNGKVAVLSWYDDGDGSRRVLSPFTLAREADGRLSLRSVHSAPRRMLSASGPVTELQLGSLVVDFDAGTSQVRLRLSDSAPDAEGRPWFRETTIQAVAWAPQSKIDVAVHTQSGELELTLDGRVLLSAFVRS